MSVPAPVDPIAVIGMACRFPHAPNIGAYWDNLVSGRECITRWSEHDSPGQPVGDGRGPSRAKVFARGLIDAYDVFDAEFFAIPPREALLLDPQHRFFLECAWEALEDAGYLPDTCDAAISVYAGCGVNSYLPLVSDSTNSPADRFLATLSNVADTLPTRVSYKLNLRGESVGVQTACSSSLVAIHLACESLRHGQSEMALAGGVHITSEPFRGYEYQEGMVLSPDGHGRAFDVKARGYVEGDGVGVVLLKPLAAAIRDKDHIWSVVRGSAINNDGAAKLGFASPSLGRQADVINAAFKAAGVSPHSIQYTEAHGAGTAMGDAIEVAALRRVYEAAGARNGACALGAVKNNVGHLIQAAGVAGFIKTALALAHGQIPPTINITDLNPELELDSSPFFVPTDAMAWPELDGVPRRAAVTSLGVGGTNAHVILEQPPVIEEPGQRSDAYPVLISARSETSLEAVKHRLKEYLRSHSDSRLRDVAFTLAVGRRVHDHRWGIVATSVDEVVSRLEVPGVSRDDSDSPLSAAVRGWVEAGGDDVARVFDNGARRVALPTYAFERTSFWPTPIRLPASPSMDDSGDVEPDRRADDPSRSYTRDEVIAVASEMFQALLGVSNVDLEDDFLALGGDSLMMLDLVDRVSTTFDLDISLDQIFGAVRLADLVNLCCRLLAEQSRLGDGDVTLRLVSYDLRIADEVATVTMTAADHQQHGVPPQAINVRFG